MQVKSIVRLFIKQLQCNVKTILSEFTNCLLIKTTIRFWITSPFYLPPKLQIKYRLQYGKLRTKDTPLIPLRSGKVVCEILLPKIQPQKSPSTKGFFYELIFKFS